VFRDSTPTASITLKISNPDGSLIGNVLCSEGRTSNTQCGALTSTNATSRGRPGFGEMASQGCGGDSGAPVINNSTLRAYGLHISSVKPPGVDCGTPSQFAWVPYFENASGYQLLLQPTTEGLGPGQRMNAGMQIVSTNGSYNATMQGDGNFVIYQPGNVAVWSTQTNGNSGAFIVMQNDGNLVVYRSNWTAAWSSGTADNSGARLVMQTDRNLVIYRTNGTAAWASGTSA
jgi:hypothetical protein